MFSRIWHNESEVRNMKLKKALHELGIEVDLKSGHISYGPTFKAMNLTFELLFVRHGKTYGNSGQSTTTGDIDLEMVARNEENHDQRIYQGDVDEAINQLNADGKHQALLAAEKITEEYVKAGWVPDLIFASPLARAKDTALPFVKMNDFADRYFIHEQIKEISFGTWDNKRVCDFASNDACHLFYKAQHALVKAAEQRDAAAKAENFCEVLLRAYEVLKDLNEKHAGKKILMFSHSMFGAACCILLGKGQIFEDGDYLAFDGKRKDDSYYTMPNATPFPLNFHSPQELLTRHATHELPVSPSMMAN